MEPPLNSSNLVISAFSGNGDFFTEHKKPEKFLRSMLEWDMKMTLFQTPDATRAIEVLVVNC